LSFPGKEVLEMNVLLIEDDKDDERLIIEAFKGSDFKVTWVTTIKSGLEAIEKNKNIDLIISDLTLPDSTGIETFNVIKSKISTIPIILLTGLADEEVALLAVKNGAQDYVIKSDFDPKRFLSSIKYALIRDKSKKELEKLSIKDGLTGAANKSFFNETLLKEWKRAQRDEALISVLMIDIDFFKEYNDHYGHLKGDEVIKEISNSIASVLKRPTDLLARFGGDEFSVILPSTDTKGVLKVANQVLESVRNKKIEHKFSQVSNIITISIGCGTMLPREGDYDYQLVLKLADEALYKAKQYGKNQIRVYDPTSENVYI